MRKTLFGALCLAAAVFQVQAASAPFVTAGFPITPVPLAFPAPESMWSNAPVGQEFVSSVSQIDYVELYRSNGGAAQYQVVLHEETITGAVVGVSTVNEPAASHRFIFSPPATVSPGATYVLEFMPLEPITNEDEASQIYCSPIDYPSGRLIWRGVADENRDLYFRAGVFVPSLFSTNSPSVTADGIPHLFDPHATFENPYITNFDGATMMWNFAPFGPAASISLASGGTAEINIAAETGDIFHNGGAVSFGHVLTNGTDSITVQFNANADGNAVGAVLRSLLYTAPPRTLASSAAKSVSAASSSSLVIIYRRPVPIPPALQITFRHPLGEVFDSRYVTPNTPPAPHILISGGGAFFGSEQVVITRRQETIAWVQCSVFGLTDSDGDLLTFAWSLPPDINTVSTLPRFTNDFALGPHTVSVTASDGLTSTTVESTFEVITPNEAIARLRADLTEKYAGSPPRSLERVLRIAARAIESQQWSLASRELEIFRKRLNRLGADEGLDVRWYSAAADIRYAVQRIRGTGLIQPPGLFPGLGVPLPPQR